MRKERGKMKNAKKSSIIKNIAPYLVLGMILGIIMVILQFQGAVVNELSNRK